MRKMWLLCELGQSLFLVFFVRLVLLCFAPPIRNSSVTCYVSVGCLCLCARWNGIKNKFAINSFIFLCFAHERKKIIIIVLFAPRTLHRRLTFYHRPAPTFPFNSFSVPRDGGRPSLSSYQQLLGDGVSVEVCNGIGIGKSRTTTEWLGCAHSSPLPHGHSCVCGRTFYIVKIPFTRAHFVAGVNFFFRFVRCTVNRNQWTIIDFIRIHEAEIVRQLNDRRQEPSWKTNEKNRESCKFLKLERFSLSGAGARSFSSPFRVSCFCAVVQRILSRCLNNLRDKSEWGWSIPLQHVVKAEYKSIGRDQNNVHAIIIAARCTPVSQRVKW